MSSTRENRTERRLDLHRRFQRRRTAAEEFDPRDPDQPESVFAGVRQTGASAGSRSSPSREPTSSSGLLGYNFATDIWNSRNAYAAEKAPFHLHELREIVSGPIGKRASFNVNVQPEWVDNGNRHERRHARSADASPSAFTGYAARRASPHRLITAHRLSAQREPHADRSATSYNRDIVRNTGIGGLNLESRGYHNDARSQTLQVTETANSARAWSTKHVFSISVPPQLRRPTRLARASGSGLVQRRRKSDRQLHQHAEQLTNSKTTLPCCAARTRGGSASG